jgi:hypothetical protein
MHNKPNKQNAMNIQNLRNRTVVICNSWIKRDYLIDQLFIDGYKHIGSIEHYQIAPHIDITPISREFQTLSKDSFVIKKCKEKKSNIDLVEI